MEDALKNIQQNLLTPYERLLFLKMAGMPKLTSYIDLNGNGVEFSQALKRACQQQLRDADEAAVIKYGNRLK